MSRSISISILAFIITILLFGNALAQDFALRESNEEVIAMSKDKEPVVNVFQDTDGDGLFDAIMLRGELVQGNMREDLAEGFRYEDGRYIVLYPADWRGLPASGTAAILGFVHYFNDEDLSTYLAIVAEQAVGDDTTNGLAVYFYDVAGLRVGAPSTVFMEKARLRTVPIYQEWVETGRDFGIGSNTLNSKFFVLAKDLGLTDHVLVVMFQLYQ